MCVVVYLLSLPLWERGFKRGVTRKIKNAIERADQGSFYFVLYASTSLERSFGMKHNGHFGLTENYYVL